MNVIKNLQQAGALNVLFITATFCNVPNRLSWHEIGTIGCDGERVEGGGRGMGAAGGIDCIK